MTLDAIPTAQLNAKAGDAAADRQKLLNLCSVVDHLVDSVNDPSCPLRRMLMLLDIDGHPNSTQTNVGVRLGIEKSVISRNVDWLVERKFVQRSISPTDSREVVLKTTPYSHGHLALALQHYGNKQETLQKVLQSFIDLFKDHMPSLRDLKAIVATAAIGDGSKQQIIDSLYGGPSTTDHRTVKQLVEEGILSDETNT